MAVTPEELAQTLIRRHAAKRADAEARAADVRARVRRAASALIRDGEVRRVWLIGSLAWGGFDDTSDVDLAVEGLSSRRAPAAWDRLSSEIGARVDLLRIEELDGDFAARVRREGQVVDVG